MFPSGCRGRKSMPLRVGADPDEGPDSVAADRDGAAAAVEADRDRPAAGRAAVGEIGVVDLAARLDGSHGAQWPGAGGACAVPARAVPPPDLGIEFSAVAVAVPVHDGEAVIAVADDRQHAGVARVPAAAGEHLLRDEPRVVRRHRLTRSGWSAAAAASLRPRAGHRPAAMSWRYHPPGMAMVAASS